MVGNEEGGVHTQKIKLFPAIVAVAVVLMSLAVILPSSDNYEGATFDIEGGKTLFSTGEVLEADAEDGIYVVKYGSVYAAHSKLVDSSGNTTSTSAVSPVDTTFTSTSSTAAEKKGLKITAPTTPGNYTLIVEFELTNGGERVTRSYPIKVVEPIVLTATLKNDTSVAVTNLTVAFVIDGREMKVESDHEDMTVGANSTKTLTYKWVTDNVSGGKHTFHLKATSEGMLEVDLTGLNDEQMFYVGQDDHMMLTIIFVIILIVLFIVLVWIIRKPVKNFGKPKGRK